MSTLQKIKIVWHEGTGEFDGREYTNWVSLQYAFNKIFKSHGDSLGYNKVKIALYWNDGCHYPIRVDVSKSQGDYNPRREDLPTYLGRTLEIPAANLVFTDAKEEPEPEPEIKQNQPAPAPRLTVKRAQIKPKAPQPSPLPQPAPKASQSAQNEPKTSQPAPILRTFADVVAMQAKTYLLN